MHKNIGRASIVFVRSNKDSTEVKNDVYGREGMVSVRSLEKKYMNDSGVKVRSGRGLRYLILKGGEPIRGVK